MSDSHSIPTLTDVLTNVLEEEGRALFEKDNNARPLRNIQRFLWEWEDSVNDHEDIRFLVFFLKTFIEKFFYNLTGDVPYIQGVTELIQRHFCNAVGQALCDLSTRLKEGNYSGCYPHYRQLGTAYLDAVDALNKEFSRLRARGVGDARFG